MFEKEKVFMMSINRMTIAIAILFCCAISMPALADVIYVDPNGFNSDGLSWDTAYTGIQAAIDVASSGDDIWVSAGTYVPSSAGGDAYEMENGVNLYGSFAGDEDPGAFDLADRDFETNATILVGQVGGTRSISVFYANGISTNSVIDGFIISGARWGVYCSSSSVSLESCIVSDCSEDGLYSSGRSVTVIDCIVENNSKRGIRFNGASASTITNSIISNNGYEGIYCSGGGMTIVNSLIQNNGREGIYFGSPGSDDTIRNNTIIDNANAGIENNQTLEDSPIISNCIVWGNNSDSDQMIECAADYSCVMGGAAGIGNISDDPAFVDADNDDFSLSDISLCIDAGDPNSVNYVPGELDLGGYDRVYNERIDIGAYEFVPPVYKTRDFDASGRVDEFDLALLSAAWLSVDGDNNYDAKYDLDSSGSIDNVDFVMFAAEWLTYLKSANFDETGAVNYLDFAIFAKSWLLGVGDGEFNEACDLDDNGDVDIDDLRSFSERWLN